MNALQTNIGHRLLYILHRGLVDIGSLANAGKEQQVFDLADALEILPRCIDHWKDDDIELVRFVLGSYQDKYPEGSFDYLGCLDKDESSDRF